MENNHTKYKETLTDDLEKEVVSFLNSTGGEIHIGVKDNGEVIGVANSDKLQLKIKDRLKDNVRPSIMGLFDIFTQEINGKTIVIVNIASGAETPYYIKQKGRSEAGCFIRIGSSSQPMTEEMIHKLMMKRHPISLRNLPSRNQELTFTQLAIYYAGKNKTLNKNFAKTLDFYTDDKEYNQVAYLFADENRVSIHLAKWAGKDKTNLIQNEEYGDQCLITALNRVLDRLDVENITQARKGFPYRIEKKYIDSDVLKEAVINAFVHNDYSQGDTPIFEIYDDRFEITTYGDLFDWIPKEDFFAGSSKPRNPEIMRVFKDIELVEHLGSGIPHIVKLYGKGIFHFSKIITRMSLKFDKSMEKETLKKTIKKSSLKSSLKSDLKIFEVIKNNPQITIEEISKIVKLSIAGIKKNIIKLKEQGKIRRVGADKGGHWEIIE
ncbi:RNA-binding domain-containing protein [Endomicrobium proavitum]|uniref:Divergent AAA domain protein, putative transcriptional regulator n=1 Tax=Endomicrobium proavitum TaxID=1408281 RepID=A0A0G3WHX5_9BACT|nr:RNA-binding domain-containing protein [Endomicrobium proavitum]AKL98286.1 Divergent AAA domain protein, putative transcriptional regulator [Endomicrobium proavitum]